jgi:amidophosphoribosyltransferase
MSDIIKHECGIALIRLLKPLEYYQLKYGSWMYGLNKLYLLMEKQHNRGQDGAGVVNLKLDLPAGNQYIFRERSNEREPIRRVFEEINGKFEKTFEHNPDRLDDPVWSKTNLPFSGELFFGHVRYGTFGRNDIETVHPVLRLNNWKARTLALAGNFNLTNVDELFKVLIEVGQHPRGYTDTVTVLEKVGHYLDLENQRIFDHYKKEGYSNNKISEIIANELDLIKVLKAASRDWDGGYAMGGFTGSGDAFVVRDPWGIRPAYYYHDDEVAVVASERPVIQTAFRVRDDLVKELEPGYAFVVKNDGRVICDKVREPQERRACSFERIYFSRGSDKDIYQERKKLGEYLTPTILEKLNNDLENTVFSFIPNTAETAFYGMIKGVEERMIENKKKRIIELGSNMTDADLDELISQRPRVEKIAVKDAKLRTFISQDDGRNDLVAHVYDITYGTIKTNKDTLVIIDDSIVRGTTLRESIIRILDRLVPKKILIVSSAPQIRYPDCYGIDMAKLGDFIAFNAAIELLKDTNQESVINEVYKKSKAQQGFPKEEIVNYVKDIYKPFTAEEISGKIGKMLTASDVKAEVEIVYQSIENLHKACPHNKGDWYFTGNYPTPGGNKVVNTSFINYIEGKSSRAY